MNAIRNWTTPSPPVQGDISYLRIRKWDGIVDVSAGSIGLVVIVAGGFFCFSAAAKVKDTQLALFSVIALAPMLTVGSGVLIRGVRTIRAAALAIERVEKESRPFFRPSFGGCGIPDFPLLDVTNLRSASKIIEFAEGAQQEVGYLSLGMAISTILCVGALYFTGFDAPIVTAGAIFLISLTAASGVFAYKTHLAVKRVLAALHAYAQNEESFQVRILSQDLTRISMDELVHQYEEMNSQSE